MRQNTFESHQPCAERTNFANIFEKEEIVPVGNEERRLRKSNLTMFKPISQKYPNRPRRAKSRAPALGSLRQPASKHRRAAQPHAVQPGRRRGKVKKSAAALKARKEGRGMPAPLVYTSRQTPFFSLTPALLLVGHCFRALGV